MCTHAFNTKPLCTLEDTLFHDKVVLFVMLPFLLQVTKLREYTVHYNSTVDSVQWTTLVLHIHTMCR